MMRGASAAAVAELSDNLATARTLAEAETIGEQLFAVARVLRTEVALRRVATDSSVEDDGKVALMESVFGSALEDGTMRVVSAAVAKRWTVSRDLPTALERLGVLSLVRSAGAAGDQIIDELFAVRRLIEGHRELRTALSDPKRTAEDRTGLVLGVLGDRVLPATAALVTSAVADADHTVEVALRDYQKVVADVQGEVVATVRTARELSQSDQTRLATALGNQYSTKVRLQVVVDPSLMGGLRVDIRDDVIDGTVSGRIDEAQRRLAG